MNHDEIVAKAEEMGLDTEDQTDEEMMSAITQAEADDAQAATEREAEALAKAAQEEAEQKRAEAEVATAQAKRDADLKAATEAQAARAALASKAAEDAKNAPLPPPSPTKLYRVNSAFDFIDPMTGKRRRAQNGSNVRLSAAQGAKYLRHRNVSLVA